MFLALLVLLSLAAGQAVVPPPAVPGQPGALPGQSAVPATAAISGEVFDVATNRPVAGAVVSLSRTDRLGQPIGRVLADERGRFVFRDLPAAATYFLDARRFNYAATRYGWTGPNGSSAIRDIALISLAEGQWVGTIRIPLWRLGSISGRVVDERGEPLVGVAVRAFTQRPIAGQPQLVAGPVVTTDDRGAYRVRDLEPGRYVVAVLSVQSTVLMSTAELPQVRAIGELETGGIGAGRGSSVSTPAIEIGPGSDGRHRLALTNFATPPAPSASQMRAYPATFFPDARTAATAGTIEIGYGVNRTGADVQVRPVPAVRVSGRVSAPTGVVPEMLLRMLPAGSERLGFGAEAATTVVERDGTFTFLNVPEGAYTILAQSSVMDFTTGSAQTRLADAPGFPGGGVAVGSMAGVPGLSYLTRSGAGSPLWGRTPVAVGGRNLDDVVVELHPVVKVSGRFAFAEGAERPDREIFVRAHPANGDPSLGQPTAFSRRGDPLLAFAMQGLFGGTYVLSVSSFGIVSVTADGRDVTHAGFDASIGRDFDNVVVTLTDRVATVRGFVSDRQGPASAAVIIFPIDRARWSNYGWDPPHLRSTRAATNGAFELPRLPAGEYYVVAIDVARKEAWADPAFLAAALPVATRISVAWGETKVQDLRIAEVVVR